MTLLLIFWFALVKDAYYWKTGVGFRPFCSDFGRSGVKLLSCELSLVVAPKFWVAILMELQTAFVLAFCFCVE